MDGIIEFLLQWGYIGLAIGTFLPLSADALLVAFLAIGGSPVYAVLAATVGNWLRAVLLYRLGRLGKWEWLEKYFRVKRESIEKYSARAEKYGALLGLLAGVPIVCDVVAVALGFFRTGPVRTTLSVFVGKALRFGLWALIFMVIKPLLG